MGDVHHLRRDALRTVARHVRETAAVRLAELGDAHGCEAAAARAFQLGRLQVAEVDMWNALGLTSPWPPPLAAALDDPA